MVAMTTKRLAVVAVVLLTVILVLGVVALVIWRQDTGQAGYEDARTRWIECMRDAGAHGDFADPTVEDHYLDYEDVCTDERDAYVDARG